MHNTHLLLLNCTAHLNILLIWNLRYINVYYYYYYYYKIELLKQNLTPIEEKFVICPSCTGIMKNASFSVGNNMCESCCPKTKKSTPVESVRETVNKLPCRCPLDTNGCAWTGVIGELETHLSVCSDGSLSFCGLWM